MLCSILIELANALREKDLLDPSEASIDAAFVNRRGGGLEIGTTRCAKGGKILAIVDRSGLLLSVSPHAAL